MSPCQIYQTGSHAHNETAAVQPTTARGSWKHGQRVEFREPDGSYAAKRDGSAADLEVIKMFNSALYVSLPDANALPAPPPVSMM